MTLWTRALTKTAGGIGFNWPTGILTILVIVLSSLVRPSSTPESSPGKGFGPLLSELIVWLTSLATVFLLLLLLNLFKLHHQDRSLRAREKMLTDKTRSLDSRMMSFLRNSLGDPRYGVAKCYAFGSVVRQDPTRDIDVVIQFTSSKQRRISIYRKRVRDIENSFQAHYNRKLHIQTFLSDEDEALQRFLIRTGTHKLIFDRR